MKFELTLTKDEEQRVAKNAKRFGFDIPRYVQFVVAQETRQMTPAMLRRLRRTLQADRAGKTRMISSFTELVS